MRRSVDAVNPDHRIVLHDERRHQQGDVDFAAPSRHGPAEERRHDAEGERHRAHVVGDGRVGGHRDAVLRPAGRGHEPATRLHDEIHRREPGVRPTRPEACDVADDEPGMAAHERRRVKAERGAETGAEIGEHDVGGAGERLDDARGRRVLEIERKRMLAAITADEQPRLAGGERGQLPHGITRERLDLDHARAAVRQELAAVGDGDELAELDDRETDERTGFRHPAGARPPSGPSSASARRP